jgi:hypothetical protein
MRVVLPISAYCVFINEADCLQEEIKLIFFLDFRRQSTWHKFYIYSMKLH